MGLPTWHCCRHPPISWHAGPARGAGRYDPGGGCCRDAWNPAAACGAICRRQRRARSGDRQDHGSWPTWSLHRPATPCAGTRARGHHVLRQVWGWRSITTCAIPAECAAFPAACAGKVHSPHVAATGNSAFICCCSSCREVGPDDIALLLHTSGTTSRPKLVPLTHGAIATNLEGLKHTYGLTPADTGAAPLLLPGPPHDGRLENTG